MRWLREAFLGRGRVRLVAGPVLRDIRSVESWKQSPTDLEPSTILLVGPTTQPKWVTFRCPCATGHTVTLNLQPSYYPRWRAVLRRDRLTLTPSIWLDEPPYCHFLLRDGRTWWVSRNVRARPWPAGPGSAAGSSE